MRIEEQISTKVAKTESDDEPGEENDPVMVTCGKLIISAPARDESDENANEDAFSDDNLQYERKEEQHFALKCIEKVDEEDFEAVFEINSDMDEIGLSESDIKALEIMESKEFIILRDKAEEPVLDDFSSSVLKFQDAIENYTKSVFTGISDTMSGIEKAKTSKPQSSAEDTFSEKLIEVENKYTGNVPVIEEPFEEVKAYISGESDAQITETKIYQLSDEFCEEKFPVKLPIVEEPFEEVKHYICGKSDSKLSISDLSPSPEEPFEEIKFSHVENLNISDEVKDDTEIDLEDKSVDVIDTVSEVLDEPIIKVSNIPKLLDIEPNENTKKIEEKIDDKLYYEKDIEIEPNDITAVIEETENTATSTIEENQSKHDSPVIDMKPTNIHYMTNKTLSLEENEPTIEEDNIELSGENKCDLLPLSNLVQKEKLDIIEDQEKLFDNKTNGVKDSSVSPAVTIEDTMLATDKLETFKTILNKEETESDKIVNQGIQRNAESRKSKKNIKIKRPRLKEEHTAHVKISEEMQLLLNTILLVTLAIFLYLICGEAPTFEQEDESESFARIPARVSGVIDGYVQLSTLSEMELRK